MPVTPGRSPLRQVLIVEAEERLRRSLLVALDRAGYETTGVSTADRALAELEKRRYDAVVAALDPPSLDGAALAEAMAARGLAVPVILLSPVGGVAAAVEAIERGAHDYLTKPLLADEVVLALRKVEAREASSRGRAAPPPARVEQPPAMIARGPRMREVLRVVERVAEHKTTVLITGESGTGKELVARALHEKSPRREGPFVAVNCGALPEALLESELFGHKKGSFTDAIRDKRGLFEEADGGTLFLDEIGELPLGPQVKLLRVLQEQAIRSVGAVEDQKVDVRLVAATVRDLSAEVQAGRFREDLFYRLNVIAVALPPLRERSEEIAPLVEHFIARSNAKLGRAVATVSPEAMVHLVSYDWPGNIRELENTIERAVVFCDGDRIEVEGLPERLRGERDPVRLALERGELSIKKTTRMIEAELIRKALCQTRGNRTNAAKLLEISHRALLYKIKEYGIDEEATRRKVVPDPSGGTM